MKKPYIIQYQGQHGMARARGIPFQFTYEEWVAWWGDDIDKRGRTKDCLVMARFNDEGPYHPDNVKKITKGENTTEALKGKKRLGGCRGPFVKQLNNGVA